MAPLTQVIQQDLSKGSNLVTQPYILGKQQSILLTNLLLDEHGSIHVREGTRKLTTSPDIAPNIRPIVKLFDFIKQDGSVMPLAILLGTTPTSPPSVSGGQISSSRLRAGGSDYLSGDTGTVAGGNNDATYIINDVDVFGGVVSYTIVLAGTGYSVATNVATTPGGVQAGIGTGFTIDILTVTSATPAPPAGVANQLYHRGTPTFLIVAASAGAPGSGTFTVSGDQGPYFVLNATFTVSGSTGNNGTYTTTTAIFGAGVTVITVVEAVPSGVVDGTITRIGWTRLGNLGTSYTLPDMLTFTGKVILINGYEVPYSFDGVSLVHLVDTPGTGAVPAGAKHHTLHQGYYWIWNTAATSSPGQGTPPVTAVADGPGSRKSVV